MYFSYKGVNMSNIENEEKYNLKCDSCGANLQVLDGKSFMFCEHCGTKILLNQEKEVVHKIVDENAVKQTEVDKILKLKEYEIYERKQQEEKKRFYIKLGLFIGGIFLSVIFFMLKLYFM